MPEFLRSSNWRNVAAVTLCVLALACVLVPSVEQDQDDTHTHIVLSGKFVGPKAGDDAVTISVLCDELARILEEDGKKEKPRLLTGQQIDELRVAAREARTGGVSIGERQPRVREEIRKFLDEAVGVSGGPVSAEQRERWVSAFFEIAKAAKNAAGQ